MVFSGITSLGNRRVLYHPDQVRRLVAGMRGDLRQMHFDHMVELKRLRIEVLELRQAHDQAVAAMREMQAAALARAQAHEHLIGLYREREIQRARVAERDPATPLQ